MTDRADDVHVDATGEDTAAGVAGATTGDERRALLVDAFTDTPLSGNAAGVVPDAAGLAAPTMQAIARELNASETAFVLPSDRADRQVRYFTPTTEVDLCGHATVASHVALQAMGTLSAGTHSCATGVGVIDVEVTADGTAWMTQDDPSVRRLRAADGDPDAAAVADVLGLNTAAVTDVDLPLAVASTGLAYLIVPVAFLEQLGGIDPDAAAIAELCERVDATGLYAFTFDTLSQAATLHGRMFAPLAGVPEDPVTGTASGAVAAYLRETGALAGDGPEAVGDQGAVAVGTDSDRGVTPATTPVDETETKTETETDEESQLRELLLEQGHFVDRPGQVRVRPADPIQVGGRATIALDGRLRIPPAEDDDDILEA